MAEPLVRARPTRCSSADRTGQTGRPWPPCRTVPLGRLSPDAAFACRRPADAIVPSFSGHWRVPRRRTVWSGVSGRPGAPSGAAGGLTAGQHSRRTLKGHKHCHRAASTRSYRGYRSGRTGPRLKKATGRGLGPVLPSPCRLMMGRPSWPCRWFTCDTGRKPRTPSASSWSRLT